MSPWTARDLLIVIRHGISLQGCEHSECESPEVRAVFDALRAAQTRHLLACAEIDALGTRLDTLVEQAPPSPPWERCVHGGGGISRCAYCDALRADP